MVWGFHQNPVAMGEKSGILWMPSLSTVNPVFWQDRSYGTVDGSEILHQLRLVVYPIIYDKF